MFNNNMDLMQQQHQRQQQQQHHRELYYKANQLQCKIKLQNDDLWANFHKLETEMIITKSGRRMFPTLRVQLENLDPNEHYCVYVEMATVTKSRFKYSASGGWAPAGAEEAQSPHKMYVHPISPALGSTWMSQIISFGRLKLTNCTTPPVGHMVLSSMHKYEPRIIIAKTSDPMYVRWSPSTTVAFPQTQFIAVTAYQNDRITKMKIDNNPFAKGFRENGQSKCKRKRIRTPEDDNDITIKKVTTVSEITVNVTDSDSDRTSSPESTSTMSPPIYNRYVYPQIQQVPQIPHMQQISHMPQISQIPPPPPMEYFRQFQHVYQYYNMYPARPIVTYPPIHPTYYHHAYNLTAPVQPHSLSEENTETPRKLTDFSIRAITGLT